MPYELNGHEWCVIKMFPNKRRHGWCRNGRIGGHRRWVLMFRDKWGLTWEGSGYRSHLLPHLQI
jgi:hypothetical protein